MSKSSERQLGAFFTLYPVILSTPFPAKALKHQKLTETRNSVVHSGGIPTRAEAESYLRGVYEVMTRTMAILLDKCEQAEGRVFRRGISANHLTAKEETGHAASGISFGILVAGRLQDNTAGFENRMALLSESIHMHVLAPQKPSKAD